MAEESRGRRKVFKCESIVKGTWEEEKQEIDATDMKQKAKVKEVEEDPEEVNCSYRMMPSKRTLLEEEKKRG